MSWRSLLLKAVGLVLFVGLFLWASPAEVLRGLRDADLGALARAGACALCGVVVKNVRWRYILALTGGTVRWRDLVPLAFVSAFFGNVTPGRFGDLWKVTFAHSSAYSRSQFLISFLYDRILDACTMAILALIGVFVGGGFGGASFAALLVLVVVAGIAAVVLRGPITRTVEGVIGRYDVGVVDLGRSARSLPLTAAGILASHLLFVGLFFATYHFLFEAVGMDVPAAALVLAGAVAAMAAVLPITVSGLGTREAVLLTLLQPYYSSPSQVILAGLLWVFVLTYFLSGIVALPLWLLGLPRKPQASDPDSPGDA